MPDAMKQLAANIDLRIHVAGEALTACYVLAPAQSLQDGKYLMQQGTAGKLHYLSMRN